MMIRGEFNLNREEVNCVLNTSSFSSWLGVSAIHEGDQLLLLMRFAEHHIGNEMIRAIHGGVMASFLECTASAVFSQMIGSSVLLRALNSDVAFLRSTSDRDTYADVKVLRHGRRLATLEVNAWQDDVNRPVASGRFNFQVGATLKK